MNEAESPRRRTKASLASGFVVDIELSYGSKSFETKEENKDEPRDRRGRRQRA